MTTYTAITAGQIDGDSPVDTVLAGQWTNNLLAIQEGDASAPKIAHAAVDGLAWALIETWIPTATAAHSFIFDESVYSDVRIVVENVIPATDGADLWVRFAHTDGATIITSANYSYEYRDVGDTAFTAVSGDTELEVAVSIGTAANEGVSGTVETFGMTSILGPKGIRSFMVGRGSLAGGGVRRTLDGDCNASMTTAFDTVHMRWNTGNFEATGTVYMYGLKKA